MSAAWIDSHCHLDFFQDSSGVEPVRQRAIAAGVTKLIIPAVAQSNWARIEALCHHQGCYGAYGLHPVFQAQHQSQHLKQLEQQLSAKNTVAIGECGLDYAIDAERKQQHDYFEAQLDIAQRLDLPVIIHARRALDDVLQHLRQFPRVRFVVHSFTGSDQQLARLLKQGGYIGIGGTCTYPRAQRLRRQVADIDNTRYLLETDAPDQPLHGYQGQANEPRLLVQVAAVLATLRAVDMDTIQRESWRNTKQLFFTHV